MESVLRAVATLIVTFADTFTMAAVSINHLARSAVERTVVVEKKAVTAAALSELDNINTVANRLHEIEDLNKSIGPDALEKAKEFIAEYQARRQTEAIGVPIHIRRAEAKSPGNRSTRTKAADAS